MWRILPKESIEVVMAPKSDGRLVAASAALTKERLREVGIFGGISDEMLELIIERFQPIDLDAGAIVFREGDSAREMFVLLEGELEVLKKSRRGRETRVAILGPSDCFGEMSIIDLQPRSATIRALAPVRMLRISTEDMDCIYRQDLKAYAMLILNIARDISRRLRVADSLVAQVTATVIDEYVEKRV
jgi:CRP/FNR family transcriptional regulator, cyclic AMP receptor protein